MSESRASFSRSSAARRRASARARFSPNRAKLAAAAEKAEADALRAEKAHAQLVAKVSAATGVPASLISGDDEESMTATAKAIAEFAKASSTAAPADKGGAASGSMHMSDETISKMTNPSDRVMAYARGYEGQ